MSDQRVPLLQRPRARLLLTLAVIAIGLAITGFFGVRSVRSFRELRYIREQGLDNGSANTTAIRPWMTIRGAFFANHKRMRLGRRTYRASEKIASQSRCVSSSAAISSSALSTSAR